MKPQSPVNKPLVRRLKAEYKMDGTFCTRLAVYMGFKTDVTIKKWIERNRIPFYHVQAVNSFLESNNGNASAGK